MGNASLSAVTVYAAGDDGDRGVMSRAEVRAMYEACDD